MKKNLYLTALAAGLFFSLSAQAQDAPPATPGAEEPKGKFTFSGYLDTYYVGNFNRPASRSNLGAIGMDTAGITQVGGNARAFDQRTGQFSLGLVQAKAVYSTSKSEAVIDLVFGPNADLGNYGNAIGPLGGTTALAIKQAYFTYKPTDKLSFTAGQFGTHIGYEVIDAPINYHYSLSNLFNNGPFYHIGVKANYAFSDKVALMAGIVNNVDQLNDNNRAKGLISQLYLQPKSGWNVYVNWIRSNEAAANNGRNVAGAYYTMLDLTTSWQITEKTLLGLNAATGTERAGKNLAKQQWGGVAAYANVAFTDVFSLGGRYEYFDNTSGVRGLRNGLGEGTHVTSYTVTGNFTLADGHLLIKPEFRLDSYPKLNTGTEQHQKFEDSNGNFTKNAQSTMTLAFIYKF